jgi:hypothetical protein
MLTGLSLYGLICVVGMESSGRAVEELLVVYRLRWEAERQRPLIWSLGGSLRPSKQRRARPLVHLRGRQ